MKRLTVLLLAGWLGLACGCIEKSSGKAGASPVVLLRVHFAGNTQLFADTNAAKLRQVWNLPSAVELREQTLGKLAQTPFQVRSNSLPQGAPDGAVWVRPLLDDLLSVESYFEMHGAAEGAEAMLSIRLSEERARLWSTNLSSLVAGWKIGSIRETATNGLKGWELKASDGTGTLQFVRGGGWVLMGWGRRELGLLAEAVRKVSKGGRPISALADHWLEADANLPQLSRWVPWLAGTQSPPIEVRLSSRDDNVRTHIRSLLPAPLDWKYEPWRFPTNLVTEPLISFSVAQGIGPWLGQWRGVRELGLKKVPSQVCAWALRPVHGQTFASVPMPNASNVLAEIAPKLFDFVKLYMDKPVGQITLMTNGLEVLWQGLPFVMPHLRAVSHGGSEFLVGGLFPALPSTNRPPPELFAQLKDRNNLLYYDWEITEERIRHWRQTYQLFDVLQQRKTTGTNAPTEKWLMAAAPLLGNSVTEITAASPRELSLVRKSHVGLTGFELVTLTRWLDSPGFPLTFQPPPPQSLPTNAAARARTNQPLGGKVHQPGVSRGQ